MKGLKVNKDHSRAGRETAIFAAIVRASVDAGKYGVTTHQIANELKVSPSTWLRAKLWQMWREGLLDATTTLHWSKNVNKTYWRLNPNRVEQREDGWHYER